MVLKELNLEISLAGVPGFPGSPQGQAPKIGSPGSAFTPVSSLPEVDTPLVAQAKVVCVMEVKDEVHKHTTLGRVLEGDVLVEVSLGHVTGVIVCLLLCLLFCV